MKNALKIFLLLSFAVIVGCCKDDDPEPKTQDGKLHFRGFDEKQILLWVGGEQRSTAQINFSKLLDKTRQSWISESYYQQLTYFFEGDTLTIESGEGGPHRVGYYFSNDSLFTMEPGYADTYWPYYGGIGSENEIRTRQGLSYVRTYRDDGTVKTGAGFNVSEYNTPESMIGINEFQGIDQMGENDTLLLYNQTKLFN